MATEGSLPETNHQNHLQESTIESRAEDEKQGQAPSSTKPRIKRENKKQYVIMMKPSIHDEAVIDAANQGLSFSALLELVLKDYLKKQ
ncbi:MULTISPECIES: hypothetical protein [Fructobacillus]|uniref:Uncharacterized protein n=1 Tax=Fructobacillus evanidus TaxID=3064281 RepID=A0ABM9MXI4_9LACO|nr:unnamed protein product [Fructobacillus sp. LMG 32999]CAK1254252.1 unnamed protein product [Fructobacillus cardui]CAK1230522.1 unnamed protein product [Fructobacillus sp. LMG 32999]CAK1231733.1 unnamed protein product [Fructobacillus sp. LMG 32999]CAK1240312.1 unnamed protein product [Fructobacillus sp. LMG 32999]